MSRGRNASPLTVFPRDKRPLEFLADSGELDEGSTIEAT
jgi:hypothetical protein